MFLGEYSLNFTGHNRVVLPKKLREALGGEGLILTRGLDGCIWGFKRMDWEKQALAQTARPIDDREGLDLRRYLFSAAVDMSLDKLGRFVIPQTLLEYAKLTSQVVIIGAGDRIEIWNPMSWKSIKRQLEVK